MQRKYNMALQHFYEAAIHSATDEEEVKNRLQDVSSASEEELFDRSSEKSIKDANLDTNESNYFSQEMSVKRVKPVSICSWRGTMLLCVWCLLFVLGVISISYCLQIAINRIPDKTFVNRLKYNNESGELTLTNNEEDASKKIKHNYTEQCNDFKVDKVWTKMFEKFRTSSSVRLVDVDGDGALDVLFGFSTSLDGLPNSPIHRTKTHAEEICRNYYDESFPCFGGVVALSGTTGKQVWIHYTKHGITSVICNSDFNADGFADCVVSGPGVFKAVNGKTGEEVWTYWEARIGDFLTPQIINDLDGDGVLDVLQFHTVANFTAVTSNPATEVLFVSGRTGTLIQSYTLSDEAVIHSSPIIYFAKGNIATVIYGTGNERHGGSLYVITLLDLFDRRLENTIEILTDKKRGYINPPVLVDLSGDGIRDIVCAGFGDKIQAVDGSSLSKLWTYHTSNTETYSVPALGFFNEDDVPDFMVRVNTGSGYPVYYDSKVLILDGKNGLPLVKPALTSVPAHTSPLTVSMEGSGNDLFLYWGLDCIGHEQQGGWYSLLEDTDFASSALSDSCTGRFGTKTDSKFYIGNRQLGLPGKLVYSTADDESDESNANAYFLHQTGAVMSSPKEEGLNNVFDLIFVTSTIVPSTVGIVTPDDVKCIKEYQAKHSSSNSTTQVEGALKDKNDLATHYCLAKRLKKLDFDDYESSKKKNFNNGHLHVHRYRVSCLCDTGKESVRVLPQKEQGWSQYMGSSSNGFFNTRSSGRLQ